MSSIHGHGANSVSTGLGYHRTFSNSCMMRVAAVIAKLQTVFWAAYAGVKLISAGIVSRFVALFATCATCPKRAIIREAERAADLRREAECAADLRREAERAADLRREAECVADLRREAERAADLRREAERAIIREAERVADLRFVYVDRQRVEQDPFGVLLHLTVVLERGFVPSIIYRGSSGVDTGGIRRDLINSLFAAAYPAVHAEPVLPDCNLSSLTAYSPATRMRLHRAIGAIFGAAVLRHDGIVIGNRFQLVLFKMIGALSAEEIRQISDDCAAIPQKIVIKLCRIYIENIDENHPARATYDDVMRLMLAAANTDQILDISNELREVYGYEPEEPVTGGQLVADTFPFLRPVCAIAKGMYAYIRGPHVDDPDDPVDDPDDHVDDSDEGWEFIRSRSAVELQAMIEGTLSTQEVGQVLRTCDTSALAYRYLQKWVQEGTRLRDFLLCSTGSGTLPSGSCRSIQVVVHPTDTERWVSFATCTRMVYLPKVLQDTDEEYRRFKERLESSMSEALSGDGFSMQ